MVKHYSAREKIEIYAQLGDLKEVDYNTLLAVAALIELLMEKGLISAGELARKARSLELQGLQEVFRESSP